MHINGQPLPSRATVSSGRILSTFALGIILAKHYEIEPEMITILGAEELKIANLSAPAMWVIGFMSVVYFINWYGDHASLPTWNSGARMQEANRIRAPLNSQITDLTNSLERLQLRGAKIDIDASTKSEVLDEWEKKWEKWGKRFMELKESAENLIKGAESLPKIEKLKLYGWYFVVPFGLAIVAFFMLLLDIG